MHGASPANLPRAATHLAAGRCVAIFDLDGTITDRDTYLTFLLFVLWARPLRLLHCVGLVRAVFSFSVGRLPAEALKRGVLRAIVGGSRRTELDPIVLRFARHCNDHMVKRRARDRIEWHRQRGHLLVLATASLDLYAHKIGGTLGFDDVVATRAAWVGGCVSGELVGPNLYGEHKLAAIHALGIVSGFDPPRVYAYSDHHLDLPLLQFADHAVAVDPTKRLASVANTARLCIEHWRD